MEVLTDSVDATRGAEHLQWAKKLYQVALEKKDEYHKEEALREIMAYYVTLKNYSELYQPNNERFQPISLSSTVLAPQEQNLCIRLQS